MSLMGSWLCQIAYCFPRLRGDEPEYAESLDAVTGFSPPTRG